VRRLDFTVLCQTVSENQFVFEVAVRVHYFICRKIMGKYITAFNRVVGGNGHV
jgi:hypothetical protein